jgi:hypothetical protein
MNRLNVKAIVPPPPRRPNTLAPLSRVLNPSLENADAAVTSRARLRPTATLRSSLNASVLPNEFDVHATRAFESAIVSTPVSSQTCAILIVRRAIGSQTTIWHPPVVTAARAPSAATCASGRPKASVREARSATVAGPRLGAAGSGSPASQCPSSFVPPNGNGPVSAWVHKLSRVPNPVDLQEVRINAPHGHYDPDNAFSVNQNITP